MEDVLQHANKVLIDKSAEGVVPYLPLPSLTGKQPTSLLPPPGSPGVRTPASGAKP
jgi:hypothetical protein